MSKSGLEDLKRDFPKFVVANKDTVPHTINLADGEAVTVPANTKVSLKSSGILQIPDVRYFDMRTPTWTDLETYGVMSRVTLEADADGEDGSDDDEEDSEKDEDTDHFDAEKNLPDDWPDSQNN